MQRTIAKPTPDMLTPAVQSLVGEILTEANREDSTPLADYIEMIQTSPIVGPAIELKVLLGLNRMGDYSNSDEDYQAFIRQCLEQMRGSLKLSIAEMLCVQPLGFACSEWAPIEHNGKWMLDTIQIMDPRKYRFRGKRGQIEDVLYAGDTGDIVVPYDRVIHLTNQRHISFGSPYGVAECKRALAAYKGWKITIAAALIAAKRRGEPITIGFAPGDEQVKVGEDSEGNPVYIPAPQALLNTLQDLENNSVAATSIANRIETIQAAEGTLILDVLKVLQQLQLMAFLVPESILSATGVGDSNLNTGHRNVLDLCVGSVVSQIKERLIEDVIRPLLIWEFGEEIEDFGSFPEPKAQEEGAIDLFNALINAVYNGAFSAADLDVINRMRELAGLPAVTEIAAALDAVPTDPASIGTPTVDDIASQFAKAAPKAKGKKKGKGQKNCDKGLNCGGSCISAKKKCRKDAPSPTVAAKPKPKGKGGGGGGDSEKPANDLIPKTDPYDPNLSVKNALGKELSYDGVQQNTPNSRIFGARDEAKYFQSYDDDTQVGWLQDHLTQFLGVGAEGSKAYADRAAYELNLIWGKTSENAKRQIIKQWGTTKNPVILSVFGDDVKLLTEPASTPKTKAKKQPKKKAANEPDPIGDALDSLFQSDTPKFAAKVAPKGKKKSKGKKNCDKGINCGGSCISAKKKCRKDEPSAKVASKAKPQAKGGGGGGSQQETPISQRASLPPLDEAKMAGFVAKINELESANDRDSVELADVRFRWEKTKTSATELLDLLDRDDSLVANILDRNKEIAKTQKEAADVLGQWRAELIDTGLDRNAARSLLKNITTGRFADRDRKEIEAALVEFHQLTNGAIGGRLRSIVKTTDRAYSEPSIGRVNPGTRESKESYKQTLFHEFAHLAEDMESRRIHNNWVRQRGGNTGDLTSLNTIIGTDRYRADEVTTKDEFISPYVGKYYGDPTALKTRAEGWDRVDTEVLSMGLEKFSDKDSMLDLYLRDREHFGLIVNFLERKRNVSIQN
jgi:hypothetical protein